MFRSALDGPSKLLGDWEDLAHQGMFARLPRVLDDEIDQMVGLPDDAVEDRAEHHGALLRAHLTEHHLRLAGAHYRLTDGLGRVDGDGRDEFSRRGLDTMDQLAGDGRARARFAALLHHFGCT